MIKYYKYKYAYKMNTGLTLYDIEQWLVEYSIAINEIVCLYSNEIQPPNKEIGDAIEWIGNSYANMCTFIPVKDGTRICSLYHATHFCFTEIECLVANLDKENRIPFIMGITDFCGELISEYDFFNGGRGCIYDVEKQWGYRFDASFKSLAHDLAENAKYFVTHFTEMCSRYGIELAEDILAAVPAKIGSARLKEMRTGRVVYDTMPSTHRRAAVMALIDKSGLCKNIDRTKKAAFVEAVTGGNINANPKDSVSYKKPEQKAIDAASELLKTIGIE